MHKYSFAMHATAVTICAATAQAQDGPPRGDAAKGKRICLADGCALCHGTVGQGGRGTGPHLAPALVPVPGCNYGRANGCDAPVARCYWRGSQGASRLPFQVLSCSETKGTPRASPGFARQRRET
jgi:hypothetical protein